MCMRLYVNIFDYTVFRKKNHLLRLKTSIVHTFPLIISLITQAMCYNSKPLYFMWHVGVYAKNKSSRRFNVRVKYMGIIVNKYVSF
jgi:hypothetical protein